MASASLKSSHYSDLLSATEKRGKATIAPNTVATRTENGVDVRLHGHLIAKFTEDGENAPRLFLFSAGWPTMTTAGRLHNLAIANLDGIRIGKRGDTLEVRPDGGTAYPMAEGEVFSVIPPA